MRAALEQAPQPAAFVPRQWQSRVLDLVSSPADDRSIVWVYDPAGGNGKSRLGTHLCLAMSGIELSGTLNDMKLAYSQYKSPIVIFDVSRAQADMSNHLYSMAECLKNGRFFSSKYQSRPVFFEPPHVIFFSNSMFESDKWTVDRVQLIRV